MRSFNYICPKETRLYVGLKIIVLKSILGQKLVTTYDSIYQPPKVVDYAFIVKTLKI